MYGEQFYRLNFPPAAGSALSQAAICFARSMARKIAATLHTNVLIEPTRLAGASQFCKLNDMDGSSSPVHTVDE